MSAPTNDDHKTALTVARSNGHDWIKLDWIGYETCRDCMVVRRADDRNKPCKGKSKLGLRSAEASHE